MSKINRDDQIEQLIAKINKEKELLSDLPASKYKTSCSFKSTTHNNSYNIRALGEVLLIGVVQQLLHYRDINKRANDFLEIYQNEIVYDGYNVDDWLADCKTAMAQIKYRKRKEQLTEDENRLKQLLSDDRKQENELESFMEKYK